MIYISIIYNFSIVIFDIKDIQDGLNNLST
jgi:hypothetical protein